MGRAGSDAAAWLATATKDGIGRENPEKKKKASGGRTVPCSFPLAVSAAFQKSELWGRPSQSIRALAEAAATIRQRIAGVNSVDRPAEP